MTNPAERSRAAAALDEKLAALRADYRRELPGLLDALAEALASAADRN